MARKTMHRLLAASSLALALAAFAPARAQAETIHCAVSFSVLPAAPAADGGAPGEDAVATVDLDKMTGEVQLAQGGQPRRLQIKAVPSAATYLLFFQRYGKGEAAPAGEKLRAGKSVVARLVAYGETYHLIFDGDVKPAGKGPEPLGGYVCR